MKLLDVAKQLDKITLEQWYMVQNCLDARRDWLEEREPQSDGVTQDNWEMKYDEWTELCELCEHIIMLLSEEKDASEEIDDLSNYILDYHYTYGGISRLKI